MAEKTKKSASPIHIDPNAPTCPWPLPAQGIDIVLLLTVIAMVMFGLLMVYSSSFIFAQERTGDGFAFIKKQLLFAAAGFGALILVCRIDYRKWFKWAYPVLGAAIVLLAAVMIPGLGARVGGAQRWLRVGGFNFQPGEFAKFAVIFFVSSQLIRKQDRLHKLAAGVISNFLVPLPALLLLLLQPDFGTTVMITIVVFCLMFLAGVPKRYLFSALALAVTAGVFLAIGTPYRRMRLMTFMDPWRDPGGKGFQILQSFVGLHNGVFGEWVWAMAKKNFFICRKRTTILFFQ